MLEVAASGDGVLDVAQGDHAEARGVGADVVHRHGHPALRAVLPQHAHLPDDGVAGRDPAQLVVRVVAVVGVHEVGGDAAEHVAPLPAEHGGDRLRRPADPAVGAHLQHDVGRVLGEQLVAGLALGELALGADLVVDVAQPDHQTHDATVVVGGPAPARRHPSVVARGDAEPELHVHGFAGAVGEPRRELLDVLGVHEVLLRPSHQLLGPVAGRALERRRDPQEAHVPVAQEDDVRAVLGQQPVAALALGDPLPLDVAVGRVAPREHDSVAAPDRAGVAAAHLAEDLVEVGEVVLDHRLAGLDRVEVLRQRAVGEVAGEQLEDAASEQLLARHRVVVVLERALDGVELPQF